MRVRLSFILDIEDTEQLCRVQALAEEWAEELDCALEDDERDQLACVRPVSEDATS